MTVALVLQGGGGLAAAQVGQLRALQEFGITPDLVVGTSSGALNAVGFAQDPTQAGLDRLERVWTGLRRGDVFPLDALGMLSGLVDLVSGLVGWRDGLVSPKRLRALIERSLLVTRLEDTVVPVHVVATDVASGAPVVLSAGSAVDALLASTALPGVFPPLVIDGRPLVDGGVAADTPIRQAEDLGATVTYVLPTFGPAPPWQVPHGAIAVLLRAISQVLGNASAADLSAARKEVHVLPAPGHSLASPFDFRSAARLIAAGYEETKAALALRTAAAQQRPRSTSLSSAPCRRTCCSAAGGQP